MKNVLLFTLTGLLFLAACNQSAKQSGPDGQDEPVLDTTPPAPNYNLAYCDSLRPFEYCALGFDFIKIGDTLTWKEFTLPGATSKDTVFEEYMMPDSELVDWITRIFEFEDGRLWLDTDVESDRYFNRARIETPKFASREGIRVGSPIKAVKETYKKLTVRPFPEYNVIEVFADFRIIYHIADKGYFDKDAVDFPLDKIPDDAPIVRIVLL